MVRKVEATESQVAIESQAEAAEPGPVGGGPADAYPDEDTWVVPEDWWPSIEPIRGLDPVRQVEPNPEAPALVTSIRRACLEAIHRILDDPDSDAELVEHAREYLAAEASGWTAPWETDALGAAVVGALTHVVVPPSEGLTGAVVADAWVGSHGLAVAAESAVLLLDVEVVRLDKAFAALPCPPPPEMRVAVRRRDDVRYGPETGDVALKRLRALIAVADDVSLAAVVASLGALRERLSHTRLPTSYLVPDQQAWVDADTAEISARSMSWGDVQRLLVSITTVTQLEALAEMARFASLMPGLHILDTMLARVGPRAAATLGPVLDTRSGSSAERLLLDRLALLPTDAALEVLLTRLDRKDVPPAAAAAVRHFPRRAMRLLPHVAAGSGANAQLATELLRGHVTSYPEFVEPVLGELPPEAAAALERMVAEVRSVPLAPPDRVPALLVSPRWERRGPRPKPVVVPDLRVDSPTRLAWLPGEQQEWAVLEPEAYMWDPPGQGGVKALEWEAISKDWDQLHRLATGPEERVLELLNADLTPRTDAIYPEPSLRRLLGRFDVAAADYVLRFVVANATSTATALLPVEGQEVALRMAHWLTRGRQLRTVALTWLQRHAEAAARDLVPAALAKPGKARTQAEGALRTLIARGHREEVLAAAAAHGEAAAAGIEALLAVDPLDQLPPRLPKLPDWFAPEVLRPVLLADRSAFLPADAVRNLCLMVVLGKPGEIYAGVEVVRPELDRASLARMAWSLFQQWRMAGYPSKDAWVLEVLAVFGDDEVVRSLAPLLGPWSLASATVRAVAGLDVLARIGTDVALNHLQALSQKGGSRGLRAKAAEKLGEVAEGLGMSADQLADRLVPDLGLDDRGELVLDYGPRRFRVGFDEQLRPVVSTEDGARLKALPKPGAKDDPALSPAAYGRFTALKKGVRGIARDQVRRLERAMVTGRRWTGAEHRALCVEHPVIWHLARRLVWAVFDTDGVPTGSFRVAEDRTLADVGDDLVTVPDDALVGVAHPLHLSCEVLKSWAEVFADYEILQPFPQLGREVFELTAEERDRCELERFRGMRVATGPVLGLAQGGWERAAPADGVLGEIYRPLPDGRHVVVGLDPGILVYAPTEYAEQTVRFAQAGQGAVTCEITADTPVLGSLDPLMLSEVLRDLEGLRG